MQNRGPNNILILFIILLFFLLINFYLVRKFSIKPHTLLNSKKNTTLFFGIITSEESIQRRNITYNYWIKKVLKYGHNYVYCTKSPIESKYNWVQLKYWGFPNLAEDQNFDREVKRLTLAEYFLKNTTYDFFINPTDDVIVDPDRINELASILGSKYDTDLNLIMLGNCQTITENNFSYLQGGSGYIMTRRMAAEFVKHSKRWINETAGMQDDYAITNFLNYVGKKPSDASVPYMVGHGFRELVTRGFSARRIKKCPKNFYEPHCRQGVHKMEDIFIFHPLYMGVERGLKAWEVFQKLIHDPNHHYGYYNVYHTTHVCKFN